MPAEARSLLGLVGVDRGDVAGTERDDECIPVEAGQVDQGEVQRVTGGAGSPGLLCTFEFLDRARRPAAGGRGALTCAAGAEGGT